VPLMPADRRGEDDDLLELNVAEVVCYVKSMINRARILNLGSAEPVRP
jgi:hypothetical protein